MKKALNALLAAATMMSVSGETPEKKGAKPSLQSSRRSHIKNVKRKRLRKISKKSRKVNRK